MALTTDTPEMIRAAAMATHRRFIERMRVQDPRHAALYCPDHSTYIGHGGLFPCTDRDHKEA